GVAGPEQVLQLVVVARARIRVLDQETDRRTGRAALEHAREDPHLVVLASLARELRGTGAAPVDVRLQVGRGELEPRRATVDDAAERGTVALAEGRHREQLAEGITGHREPVLPSTQTPRHRPARTRAT